MIALCMNKFLYASVMLLLLFSLLMMIDGQPSAFSGVRRLIGLARRLTTFSKQIARFSERSKYITCYIIMIIIFVCGSNLRIQCACTGTGHTQQRKQSPEANFYFHSFAAAVHCIWPALSRFVVVDQRPAIVFFFLLTFKLDTVRIAALSSASSAHFSELMFGAVEQDRFHMSINQR